MTRKKAEENQVRGVEGGKDWDEKSPDWWPGLFVSVMVTD
jgi:hypothetical protein